MRLPMSKKQQVLYLAALLDTLVLPHCATRDSPACAGFSLSYRQTQPLKVISILLSTTHSFTKSKSRANPVPQKARECSRRELTFNIYGQQRVLEQQEDNSLSPNLACLQPPISFLLACALGFGEGPEGSLDKWKFPAGTSFLQIFSVTGYTYICIQVNTVRNHLYLILLSV